MRSMEVVIAFSGRILLENRQPPPEPVAVTVNCLGRPVSEWTDNKGRFSIPLGSAAWGGGSFSGDVSALTGCNAEIRLAGYAPYERNLGKSLTMRDLDAGDIVLKPAANGAAASFSRFTASAPESVRREYTRALEAAGSKDYQKAVSLLDRAAEAYPRFASALFLKGVLLERMGRRDDARQAYLRAAEADPAYVKPLVQLAEMYAEDQDPVPASEWARRANDAAPGLDPGMYLIEGAALFNLNQFEEAERAARLGVKADPAGNQPRLFKLLGEVLFRRHKYTEARLQFEHYLSAANNAPDAAQVQEMAARCERLARILGN